MEILYALEKIRVPILNELMLLITRFGEETAFLVAALIVYWCVDKRKGYYIMAVGFIGTIASQFMKLWYRIPRPWVLDDKFTILEQAREAADGYSFPSGHSQSAVGTFGAIAVGTKNRWVKIGAILIAVLVPFSRMYIGVHTPMDVLVGAGMSLVLILLLCPVIFKNTERNMPILLGGMVLLALGYLWFVERYPFPTNIDFHNLSSGRENAYTLLGALLGMVAVYILDTCWLHFSTKAVWWAQILKVVFGLVLVLAVKAGLKAPLNALMGEEAGRTVRYFLIVLVAGGLWPLSFRLFSKTGSKE